MMTRENSDNDTIQQIMQFIDQRPLLTQEEMRDLARRRDEGDESAVQKLVEHNLRLVVSLAHKHRGGMPLADAIQEGTMGLVRAAKGFNPEQGCFSTYATWWIHNHIDRGRRNYVSVVKTPHSQATALRQLRRWLAERDSQGLPAPDAAEVAERFELKEEQASALLRAARPAASLDAQRGEKGSLMDQVGERDQSEQALDRVQVEKLLQQLQPRQAQILRLRFGIGTQDPLSLQETGKVVGLTKERCRQVEKQALQALMEEVS